MKQNNLGEVIKKPELIALSKGKTYNMNQCCRNLAVKLSFVISNPLIVSVSDKGLLQAKNEGTAMIHVSAGTQRYYVKVVVCDKRVAKALNYGVSAIGSSYSIPKRMAKGYYDCSSLTWRSYHKAGVHLVSRFYASNAATIGEYLTKKNRIISKEDLMPGDLLFFCFDGLQNGRFMDICHVAIYAGAYPQGNNDPKSAQEYLIEARYEGIGLYEFSIDSPYAENIVLMARPVE